MIEVLNIQDIDSVIKSLEQELCGVEIKPKIIEETKPTTIIKKEEKKEKIIVDKGEKLFETLIDKLLIEIMN